VADKAGLFNFPSTTTRSISMRHEGKVLFTTGAGSGLARAVAQRFTREGGRVAVADFNVEAAGKTAAGLPGAIALQVDVTEEDAMARAIGEAHRHFGRIDCAFPAAGIADFDPIENWSLARFYRMLHTHLGGTFLAFKYLIPIMKAQGGGAIVTVASVAGLVAQPGNAPYGAAKAGILQMSRHVAADVASHNIRVNIIAPGSIQTGMTEPLYVKRGEGDLAKGAAMSGSRCPMARVGQPDEIAAPVCHLLSAEASYMTGHCVVVDGGLTVV
jgi:NAD(P)-dependent dehydrogenase (short-subunit alcohol dehydrogenase family)